MGELIRSFPQLTIVAVTIHSFPDKLAKWFIIRGVKYYIKLTDGIAEFHRGLRCIREGKEYIAPTVQSIIDALPEWPEAKKKADRRQMEVLVMLCNGNSPVDIADCLHISRSTVDWHIEELRNVFHVDTREQLISMAFCLDMVTKEDLCFFSRNKQKRNVALPEWTMVKRSAIPIFNH